MPKDKKDTEITEDEIKDDVQEDIKPEKTDEKPKKDIKPDNSNTNPDGATPNSNYEKDLAELHKQLEEAMNYKEKYEESVKYKEQYEDAQKELKGHEEALKQIAQDRIEQLPDEYKDLVPEGSTQDQLDWLRKADKSGLFKAKEAKSIGSSSRTNDKETKKQKEENMSPLQKLTSGIGDFYKKG